MASSLPRHYLISRLKIGGQHFALKEGREVLGTLNIKGVNAGSASISVEGRETVLSRTALLRKNLILRRLSDSSAMHFETDLLSRGQIEVKGKKLHWVPVSLSWNKWAWRDANGRTLMEIKLRHGFGGVRGEVRSGIVIDEIWEKELALLGWYLLLLNHGNFGMHILSAFRVYSAKRA